jgi:hypothetical protein
MEKLRNIVYLLIIYSFERPEMIDREMGVDPVMTKYSRIHAKIDTEFQSFGIT